MSPYAVTSKSEKHTSKRPKSAVTSQRKIRELSEDVPRWIESVPVITVGWADRTGEEVVDNRQLRKLRPKSAPATRERYML